MKSFRMLHVAALSAICLIAFAACNNNNKKTEQASTDSVNIKKDSTTSQDSNDSSIKMITVSFPKLDSKLASSLTEIVNQYLKIKNALANDKGSDAADAGKVMAASMSKLDKSLLSAEQKKIYDFSEESLKEDAEHIGKNGDNIKHQREHFANMSEEVYSLVKAFGGGRELYRVHCPMYNEDKSGAYWLSETKEVSNPYFGAEMPTCGEVQELIK